MIQEPIGGGSFGKIYKGSNIITGENVAIKVEAPGVPRSNLGLEAKIYRMLQGSPGFPEILYYGVHVEMTVLVINLLGRSLQSLVDACGRPSSLKTVLMLADQMLSRLCYLHRKGLIHRDIKPENIVTGCGEDSNVLYLIDFGLAKKYRDLNTHFHNVMIGGKTFVGTSRFASLHAHEGLEQSRRDDLEGLAYTLIWMLKGGLPWQEVMGETDEEKMEYVYQQKKDIPISELCSGLPVEFATFLTEVRALEFEEEPDYAKYQAMFRNLFIEQGYVYDYEYDWSEAKANLGHEKTEEDGAQPRARKKFVVNARKSTQLEQMFRRVNRVRQQMEDRIRAVELR